MKKEIIKPFDLASYKNGAKVKTRDGNEVRIICTDAKHLFYPIIALIKVDGNRECTISYTTKGKVYYGLANNNKNDLVIVEKAEEPEFWSDRENATITGYVINEYSSIEQRRIVTNDPACYNIFATEKHAKSARAMARISQIMTNDIENFGGAITDEEWKDSNWKYVIYRNGNNVSAMITNCQYYFLAFHTEAQRALFLKKYHYLVKEYLMVD